MVVIATDKPVFLHTLMNSRLPLFLISLFIITLSSCGNYNSIFGPNVELIKFPTQTDDLNNLQTFDNDKFVKLLKQNVDELEGKNGQWKFMYRGIPMLLFADDQSNTLMILSAIQSVTELGKKDIVKLLEANFRGINDVRYAIYKGKVYGTFTHKLNTLTDIQLRNGLTRVANLVINYGTTYSSQNI